MLCCGKRPRSSNTSGPELKMPTEPDSPRLLGQKPPSIPILFPLLSSTSRVATPLNVNLEPRPWYLSHMRDIPLPIPYLSTSSFLPPALVTHLIKQKKSRAIGVKWQSNNNPPDAITNVEGALHTFLTPLVPALIHGDYVWRGSHQISRFWHTDAGLWQRARPVVISGLVHLDFEYEDVMWDLVRADAQLEELCRTAGTLDGPLAFPELIPIKEKQDSGAREVYDRELRRAARSCLLQGLDLQRFIESSSIASNCLAPPQAISLLFDAIAAPEPTAVLHAVQDKWLIVHSISNRCERLSLLLLFLAMLHQVRNEHTGLEDLLVCSPKVDLYPGMPGLEARQVKYKNQGYVYTYSPPVIFRTALGEAGAELMLGLYAGALRHLAASNTDFASSMKTFAYNDFASSRSMDTIKMALRTEIAKGLTVMRKADLFAGGKGNLYTPTFADLGCVLVLHNNSDAFGRNIESETGNGSLDAVIGRFSTMAASLKKLDDTEPKAFYHSDASLNLRYGT